jgi:hypothetical protein
MLPNSVARTAWRYQRGETKAAYSCIVPPNMKVLSLVKVGPLLQTFTVTFHAPSSFPPTVRCPVAVGATMVTNAQATTKGAIMVLSNCVFISVINCNPVPCGTRNHPHGAL